MEFVWTATFCCLAWFSGAMFGAWISGRRTKLKENRQRRSYFEEESDRWRPLRRMARRFISVSIALVSLLLVLALAYLISVPRPRASHVNLRGRVAFITEGAPTSIVPLLTA